MAAAAILDFGNFKFLTVWALKRFELRPLDKCCRNRSKRGWDMAIFQFFKMAAVRHLAFPKVGNFNFRFHSEAQYASPCQIRENRSWDMADFRFFKMAAAAILDFGNFNFSRLGTLKRVDLRMLAKFCRNRLKRGWDMAIFQLFKMAAVRDLEFLKVREFQLPV